MSKRTERDKTIFQHGYGAGKAAADSNSRLIDGLSCDVPDMIDRLTEMAREKDMEAMDPTQERIKGTHKADARCLRKCVSMIVALTR